MREIRKAYHEIVVAAREVDLLVAARELAVKQKGYDQTIAQSELESTKQILPLLQAHLGIITEREAAMKMLHGKGLESTASWQAFVEKLLDKRQNKLELEQRVAKMEIEIAQKPSALAHHDAMILRARAQFSDKSAKAASLFGNLVQGGLARVPSNEVEQLVQYQSPVGLSPEMFDHFLRRCTGHDRKEGESPRVVKAIAYEDLEKARLPVHIRKITHWIGNGSTLPKEVKSMVRQADWNGSVLMLASFVEAIWAAENTLFTRVNKEGVTWEEGEVTWLAEMTKPDHANRGSMVFNRGDKVADVLVDQKRWLISLTVPKSKRLGVKVGQWVTWIPNEEVRKSHNDMLIGRICKVRRGAANFEVWATPLGVRRGSELKMEDFEIGDTALCRIAIETSTYAEAKLHASRKEASIFEVGRGYYNYLKEGVALDQGFEFPTEYEEPSTDADDEADSRSTAPQRRQAESKRLLRQKCQAPQQEDLLDQGDMQWFGPGQHEDRRMWHPDLQEVLGEYDRTYKGDQQWPHPTLIDHRAMNTTN